MQLEERYSHIMFFACTLVSKQILRLGAAVGTYHVHQGELAIHAAKKKQAGRRDEGVWQYTPEWLASAASY